MRPPAALAARHRRDRPRDLPGLHALRHQVVGDGDMDPWPLAVREQHRDRALVAGAERVHHQPDLVAVVEIALVDVERDVADLLDRSLLPAPGSLLQQLLHPLLELPVFLDQLLDATHQVFRLRLEDQGDRKSTRLNSSHRTISYAVFCLKKKTTTFTKRPRKAPSCRRGVIHPRSVAPHTNLSS